MPSIHDSLLTGYTVDADAQTIIMHTRPHQGGGVAHVDIIFRGVAAYHFEGDCLYNVVFGVDEVPVGAIIGNEATFAERNRLYGWPRGWDARQETFEDFLIRQACHVFELTCSYGMYGWIAATTMQLAVIREPSSS